ncbi:MAG: type I polyketide synthase [Solirubrobacterales bacterium]
MNDTKSDPKGASVPNQDALLDSLKKVTIELRSTRERLLRAEEARAEPIAIVGMGCRYPGGVRTPDDLWELVRDERDAICGIPENRGWPLERLLDPDPTRVGTIYTREGGYMHDAGEFDASFFGLGPVEAKIADPQLRLLMETAWESCEVAGIDPERLKGTRTGVFAGCMYHQYGIGVDNPGGLRVTDGTGAVISGYVSYAFGLNGPAVSIDTACSSSLVSIHLACQSLIDGESSLALAGGVALVVTPEILVEYSRQRGLAPDGRCKAFAAGANGIGWGEGAGLLLLERLSDAEANGHRPLALIRGSAINQDGASNGFMAPSGPAQERVIRSALENAGLGAAEVDAVEAHGTGTILGDPIEARAVLATYGRDRADAEPLWLGSLKSNIGHSQAAAGVGGVIKMVMALKNETLPRSLYAEEPTQEVDWEAGEVELLTEPRPWPRHPRPRRAGISSFGATGTNAHLILEEAPAPDSSSAPAEDPPATPLLLSAKSPEALAVVAERLGDHLRRHPEAELGAVAHTLATGRSHFEHRAVVAASGREQVLGALDAVARGEESDDVALGVAAESAAAKKPVFLFPGQGSQWASMAIGLLDDSPRFAQRIAECEEALAPHVEWSLSAVLRGDENAPPLDQIDVVQPTLFSMAVALTDLWRAWGVEPVAVLGHSQGEIAAAHVVGALDLDDAARLVARRSQVLMEHGDGAGGMALAAISPEELSARVAGWEELVSLAAINGPSSIVLSGVTDGIEEVLRRCEEAGIWTRRIRGASGAGHSPAVEPMREDLIAVAAGIEARSVEIPFYSSVTGGRIDTAALDAEYWFRNARETVRFGPTVELLLEEGFEHFIEPSPNPLLAFPLGEALARAGVSAKAVSGTLRRDRGGEADFLHGVGSAWANGVEVDWESSLPTPSAPAPLPTYPFRGSHFWLQGTAAGGDASAIGLESTAHPLLGAVVRTAEDDRLLFSGRLSLETEPWLGGHGGMGMVLVPGAAFVELALHAGRELGWDLLEELTLEAPLLLPPRGAVQIQLSVAEADEDGRRDLRFYARPETADGEEAAEWVRHAAGALAKDEDGEAGRREDFARAWPPPGAEELRLEGFYDELAAVGMEYGPSFQNVRAAWVLGDCLYTEVDLAAAEEAVASLYGLHPALLDGAIHSMGTLVRADGEAELEAGLPFSFSRVSLRQTGASSLRVMLQRQGESEFSLRLADQSGADVGAVDSIVVRPVPAEMLASEAGAEEGMFTTDWAPVAVADDVALPVAFVGEPTAAAALGLTDALAYPDIGSLASAVGAGEAAPKVALLPVPGGAEVVEALHEACRVALQAAQDWLNDERLAGVRLAFLTTGAVEVTAGEPLLGLSQSPVWGLVRVAQSEHPGRFVLVDLDGEPASAAALPAALALDEPSLALRQGESFAARLRRAQPAEVAPARALDPEGTVLLTGGTGDLAGVVARHLVDVHGARHLLLASRSGGTKPGTAELRAELEGLGAKVEFAACDVSDRERLAELLAAIDPAHPLTAVIHTAAVLDDGLLSDQTAERFDPVLAAKADAAWHLHELTAERDLAAFVLFSSLAGVVGFPGQPNYAAANCFLDALAVHRRAAGLPATSIAWGLWERTRQRGEEIFSELQAGRLLTAGFPPIEDEQGMALFDAAIASPRGAVVAAPTNQGVWRALASIDAPPPLLRELVPARLGQGSSARVESLARRLASVPVGEREDAVVAFLFEQIAAVLGLDAANELDPDVPFMELGFDSLAILQLRNRLNAATGLNLTPSVAFDHPTMRSLAAHLAGEIEVDVAPAAAGVVLTTLLRGAAEEGRTGEFLAHLLTVSTFRPSFTTVEESEVEPYTLRLARGTAPALLACVPSVTPISGPHEYARLAREFEDERGVLSTRWPGFNALEPIPATLEVAAELQAAAILEASDGAPFVLLGHSTGGVLAYRTAHCLEDQGRPPLATVLLDSYYPSYLTGGSGMAAVGLGIAEGLLAGPQASIVDDIRLTAMAAYLRLLGEIEAEPLAAPLLLVRATEQIGGSVGDGDWRAHWDVDHDVVDVPGNHLTMMDEHVESTARAISEWLAVAVPDESALEANEGREVRR